MFGRNKTANNVVENVHPCTVCNRCSASRGTVIIQYSCEEGVYGPRSVLPTKEEIVANCKLRNSGTDYIEAFANDLAVPVSTLQKLLKKHHLRLEKD